MTKLQTQPPCTRSYLQIILPHQATRSVEQTGLTRAKCADPVLSLLRRYLQPFWEACHSQTVLLQTSIYLYTITRRQAPHSQAGYEETPAHDKATELAVERKMSCICEIGRRVAESANLN